MNRLELVLGCFAITCQLVAQSPQKVATVPVPGNGPEDSRPAPWAISQDKVLKPYGGVPGTPATMPPPGLYVAMGDSITFGVGVKENCQPFPVHPVDVEVYCPNGTSYAVLVAKALRKAGIAGHFMDVGIGGAHVERVISDEIPYLPSEATLITIYIGTNDSRPGAKPNHNAKYFVDMYERQYEEMLTALHAKAPKARIVLINFPNQMYLNGSESAYKIPAETLPLYDEVSQTLTAFINSHYPAYAVVDTACDPASYDWTLHDHQSVHPNEQGAAILAASVLRVLSTDNPPPPPTSCKWFSQVEAAKFGDGHAVQP